MFIEWLIFLSVLAIMLEASVKTIDRFRELVRHIIEKKVEESDIQKLELLALSLLTTIVFGLNEDILAVISCKTDSIVNYFSKLW